MGNIIMKKICIVLVIIFGISSYASDLQDGINAIKDKKSAKAHELFSKACDANNANGCMDLGIMYDTGNGVKQNKIKAVQLYTKACDGGNAKGCLNAGLMYGNAEGVEGDYSKAFKLLSKACEGKNAKGCFYLGGMYLDGK